MFLIERSSPSRETRLYNSIETVSAFREAEGRLRPDAYFDDVAPVDGGGGGGRCDVL